MKIEIGHLASSTDNTENILIYNIWTNGFETIECAISIWLSSAGNDDKLRVN
jgi:hypothetical protein